MSLALARKYRPSTFADLVGQDTVSQTLSLALDGDRLSHAYLFSGLRGSGKTSTARIFAKALLCESGASSHPCGECDQCRMADESRHMDIIEMDAASNRGIDDIKEIIEHTKYKPGIGRYKIFIIDEVHMLTPQAFNALLKTLEEPPSFVKFILATTDPLKLPATILSRTQHFRFKKIPTKVVLHHLEHILDLEGVGYEVDALEILARTGAGSLRDSLTLLDQAIVYSKNYVDVATVTGMLGIIEPSILDELLASILAKDHDSILEFIKLSSEYETEMVLDELSLYLKERLFDRDSRFSPLTIDRFFRILAQGKELLALGSDGEFVLSITLFKMIESMSIRDIDGMIKSLQKELSGVEISTEESTTTPEPIAKPISTPTEETPPPPKEEKLEIPKPTEVEKPIETTVDIPEPTVEPVATPKPKTDRGRLKFKTLVEKIYDRNYDLGVCFEQNIGYISYEDNRLTWESSAEGEDKKLLIQSWSIIKMFVQDLFGIETAIESKKKLNTKPIEEITPPISTEPTPTTELPDEPEEMKSSCIAPDAGDTEAAKEKDPSELLKEPMIEEMIKLFDPKKVRIKRNV